MENTETIDLAVDVTEAEDGLQAIAKSLTGLGNVAKEAGAEIAKAFAPVVNSLQKIEKKLSNMTASVTEATDAIKKLTDQFDVGDSSVDWSDGLSTTLDGLALFAELAALILTVTGKLGGSAVVAEGALAATGTSVSSVVGAVGTLVSSLGAGGTIAIFGGVAAAIAAVIAAIVLLVTNWDTCKAALSQGFAAFASLTETTWRTLYETIFLPIAQFFGETIDALWENHLKGFWDNMCRAFNSIGEGITTLWKDFLEPILAWAITVLAPIINTVVAVITGGLGAVLAFVSDVVGNIVLIIGGIIEFLVSVFTGDWQGAWEGITEILDGVFGAILGVFKGVINGFILIINTFMGLMYSVVVGVWNAIFGFIEMIGGWLGYDLNLTLPTEPYQIPYLAQGAVLPANRPFLAMVGDQRHGTNIEAPLATIQEAVALVMQDQTAAILSGVQVDLGIWIGDENRQKRFLCLGDTGAWKRLLP